MCQVRWLSEVPPAYHCLPTLTQALSHLHSANAANADAIPRLGVRFNQANSLLTGAWLINVAREPCVSMGCRACHHYYVTGGQPDHW